MNILNEDKSTESYKVCTVVCLFGSLVEDEISFVVDLDQHIVRRDSDDVSQDGQERTLMPWVKFQFLPWPPSTNQSNNKIKKTYDIIKFANLPPEFDIYDGFGEIAYGAPNQIDSFTIRTSPDTKKVCSCILFIEYIPKSDFFPLILPGYNEWDGIVIDPILNGIRLLVGGEPYPYKAFSLFGGKFMGNIIKWPMGDINFPPIAITMKSIQAIENVFVQLLHMKVSADKNTGLRIIATALGYYHFGSTIRDPRTSFMQYMIAIEGLFRHRNESSGDGAARRIAQLIEVDRAKYVAMKNFISTSNGSKEGCFQLRNEIVHGGIAKIDDAILDKLRHCLRDGIVEVILKVIPKMRSNDDYYSALDRATNVKFVPKK